MISVIIPVYNGESTLGPLLDSLKRNDYRDREILVVDDGSTDNTREIASKYTVKLESTGGRRGPAVGRNIGAKTASGDVLLFLDSDTEVPAHLLAHVVNRFDSEPGLVALVGYYDKSPLNRGFFPRYKALIVHHWFRNAKVMESFETCCGAIRRDAFMKAGGFDETYTDADVEDYEFGHRVSEQGPIYVDHKMIVGHNFPGFLRNFTNYHRRARLWMKLFLKRRRFESTASTSSEGLTRILAVMSVLVTLAGAAWTPLFYAGTLIFIVYLVLLRDFLGLLMKEGGLFFTFLSVLTHVVNSFAVVSGVLISVLLYISGRRGR